MQEQQLKYHVRSNDPFLLATSICDGISSINITDIKGPLQVTTAALMEMNDGFSIRRIAFHFRLPLGAIFKCCGERKYIERKSKGEIKFDRQLKPQ